MIGAWDEHNALIATAETEAELWRIPGLAQRASLVCPVGHEPPEVQAASARGDLAAIAALSVSALTLAIVPLTLDQLEALLLIEGRRAGGGRSTALREISLAIDAVRA